MRASRVAAAVLLVAMLAAARAVADPARVERRLGAMGTALRLEVEADGRGQALAASEAAVLEIEGAERRLSTWRGDTELARLNRAPIDERIALEAQTARELQDALACARETAGAFDPTVGALVEAWGLRGAGRIPDEAALRDALARTGHARLQVDEGAAVRHADVRVEEGGFGKGAALDRAIEALRRVGARAALLDLGGQVAVLGRSTVVPVARPDNRDEAALEVELSDGSISTSANSERGRVVDGQRLGHLLDPRTGRPAPEIGSVSVLAQSAARADCLSTALYVMGADAALAWARERPDVQVIVMQTEPSGLLVRASAGLRGRLRAAPGSAAAIRFEAEKLK